MAGDVARRLFEIEELREHTWNPLLANPGQAIYMLLARDYAPLPDRLHSLAGRLARGPGRARGRPRQRSGGCRRSTWRPRSPSSAGRSRWSRRPGPASADRGPAAGRRAEVDQARPAALEALAAHRDWLAARLAEASAAADGFADPRLGPELFSRKLSLTLQAAADADAILARAEADLERITDEITRVAAGPRRHAARGARPARRGRTRRGDDPGVLRRRRSPRRPPSSATTTWSRCTTTRSS